METRQQIGFAAAGVVALALVTGGVMLHRPGMPAAVVKADMAGTPSVMAVAAATDATPASGPQNVCLQMGIAITLNRANFRMSGPPALTLVTGNGVDDEINFATKAGVEKGCREAKVDAKAIALNFDAMDKDWGVSADWRNQFCGAAADEATRFLCDGEERAHNTPRRLALVAIYDPVKFDGESMFRQEAPLYANFLAWKDRLTKAGSPPPTQADGDFDVYPGGIWVQRDTKEGDPYLVSCDTDGWPVAGQHYCIGTLGLGDGLRARLEFRTTTSQIGNEAAAARDHLQTLLAAWRSKMPALGQAETTPSQPPAH